MRLLALVTLAALSGLSAGAFAANEMVYQKGRVFSNENMAVKKGASLTFINDVGSPGTELEFAL